MDERFLNNKAKIVVKIPFAMECYILEINETHHVIETSSSIQRILNEDVIQVDVKKVNIVNSDLD